MYIPKGYGTVFPYMVVEGSDKLTDFLAKVFVARVQVKLCFRTVKTQISESESESQPL